MVWFPKALFLCRRQSLARFKPPCFSFVSLRPRIKLPLDDHREHPHLARHGAAVCIDALLVRENPDGFCADGATDSCFFKGFARGGLRWLESFDGPALGYGPASRLPRRNEHYFECIGFRESVGQDAVLHSNCPICFIRWLLPPRGRAFPLFVFDLFAIAIFSRLPVACHSRM